MLRKMISKVLRFILKAIIDIILIVGIAFVTIWFLQIVNYLIGLLTS